VRVCAATTSGLEGSKRYIGCVDGLGAARREHTMVVRRCKGSSYARLVGMWSKADSQGRILALVPMEPCIVPPERADGRKQ
jgi:hypothetical protein